VLTPTVLFEGLPSGAECSPARLRVPCAEGEAAVRARAEGFLNKNVEIAGGACVLWPGRALGNSPMHVVVPPHAPALLVASALSPRTSLPPMKPNAGQPMPRFVVTQLLRDDGTTVPAGALATAFAAGDASLAARCALAPHVRVQAPSASTAATIVHLEGCNSMADLLALGLRALGLEATGGCRLLLVSGNARVQLDDTELVAGYIDSGCVLELESRAGDSLKPAKAAASAPPPPRPSPPPPAAPSATSGTGAAPSNSHLKQLTALSVDAATRAEEVFASADSKGLGTFVEGVATLLESGPAAMFGGDVVAGLLRAVYGAASQAVSNADNVRRLLQTAVACAAALARAEQDTLVRRCLAQSWGDLLGRSWMTL
jgi:hypothetical protein